MARRDALLRLHKALLARRADLRKKLADDLNSLRSVSGQEGDAADAAFETGSDEMASQLAELESRELGKIERALDRLKQGTYGVCENCGGKIPVGRLNALPYSTLCIKCQRELEEDGGLGGERGGNWENVFDTAGSAEEQREIRLSDLEIDLSGNR
jgi:DnaK suppressor protein